MPKVIFLLIGAQNTGQTDSSSNDTDSSIRNTWYERLYYVMLIVLIYGTSFYDQLFSFDSLFKEGTYINY